jgi:hypothetical protein
MQIHTCSDQTKPQQKIPFWTDILADANLVQRYSRVAWVDEEGGEIWDWMILSNISREQHPTRGEDQYCHADAAQYPHLANLVFLESGNKILVHRI